MKKIILFISFFNIVQFTYAQGDLQFNQVLSYTGSISCSNINVQCAANSPSSYTVPAGKVWKLESAGYYANTSQTQAYLIINGSAAYRGTQGGGGATSANGNLISSPVWLKANDVLSYGLSGSGAGAWSLSMHLSIIEFNIVP